LRGIDEITKISGFEGWILGDVESNVSAYYEKMFLMKKGNAERIFGDLNPIVLTQRSKEKDILKIYSEEKVYRRLRSTLTIFLFFFRIFAIIWIIEPTNSE